MVICFVLCDSGKEALIERMESRHGIRTAEAVDVFGADSAAYTFGEID